MGEDSWWNDPWPGYDPSYFPSGGGGGGGSTGNGFWNALTAGLQSATSILGTRYAVPQLNPGQVIQTGPQGTYMSQNASGSINFAGGGSSNLLLLGGAALVAFMMLKK